MLRLPDYGNYSLIFEFVIGVIFDSMIAFDDVQIASCDVDLPRLEGAEVGKYVSYHLVGHLGGICLDEWMHDR